MWGVLVETEEEPLVGTCFEEGTKRPIWSLILIAFLYLWYRLLKESFWTEPFDISYEKINQTLEDSAMGSEAEIKTETKKETPRENLVKSKQTMVLNESTNEEKRLKEPDYDKMVEKLQESINAIQSSMRGRRSDEQPQMARYSDGNEELKGKVEQKSVEKEIPGYDADTGSDVTSESDNNTEEETDDAPTDFLDLRDEKFSAPNPMGNIFVCGSTPAFFTFDNGGGIHPNNNPWLIKEPPTPADGKGDNMYESETFFKTELEKDTIGAMFMCMRDQIDTIGKSSDEDDSSLHVNVNSTAEIEDLNSGDDGDATAAPEISILGPLPDFEEIVEGSVEEQGDSPFHDN